MLYDHRPDEIPDSAMPVEHGLDTDHQNWVTFPVTDVIQWYTVYESGEVQCEEFVATDVNDREVLEEYLSGKM